MVMLLMVMDAAVPVLLKRGIFVGTSLGLYLIVQTTAGMIRSKLERCVMTEIQGILMVVVVHAVLRKALTVQAAPV
jgi:hypothetical protein